MKLLTKCSELYEFQVRKMLKVSFVPRSHGIALLKSRNPDRHIFEGKPYPSTLKMSIQHANVKCNGCVDRLYIDRFQNTIQKMPPSIQNGFVAGTSNAVCQFRK